MVIFRFKIYKRSHASDDQLLSTDDSSTPHPPFQGDLSHKGRGGFQVPRMGIFLFFLISIALSLTSPVFGMKEEGDGDNPDKIMTSAFGMKEEKEDNWNGISKETTTPRVKSLGLFTSGDSSSDDDKKRDENNNTQPQQDNLPQQDDQPQQEPKPLTIRQSVEKHLSECNKSDHVDELKNLIRYYEWETCRYEEERAKNFTTKMFIRQCISCLEKKEPLELEKIIAEIPKDLRQTVCERLQNFQKELEDYKDLKNNVQEFIKKWAPQEEKNSGFVVMDSSSIGNTEIEHYYNQNINSINDIKLPRIKRQFPGTIDALKNMLFETISLSVIRKSQSVHSSQQIKEDTIKLFIIMNNEKVKLFKNIENEKITLENSICTIPSLMETILIKGQKIKAEVDYKEIKPCVTKLIYNLKNEANIEEINMFSIEDLTIEGKCPISEKEYGKSIVLAPSYEKVVETLRHMPKVTTLTLNIVPVSLDHEKFKFIISDICKIFSSLKVLTLANLSGEQIEQLLMSKTVKKNLSSIKKLNLPSLYKVENEGEVEKNNKIQKYCTKLYFFLEKLKNLKELSFEGNTDFGPNLSMLADVLRLGKLETLNLKNMNLNSKNIEKLYKKINEKDKTRKGLKKNDITIQLQGNQIEGEKDIDFLIKSLLPYYENVNKKPVLFEVKVD